MGVVDLRRRRLLTWRRRRRRRRRGRQDRALEANCVAEERRPRKEEVAEGSVGGTAPTRTRSARTKQQQRAVTRSDARARGAVGTAPGGPSLSGYATDVWALAPPARAKRQGGAMHQTCARRLTSTIQAEVETGYLFIYLFIKFGS